MQLDKSTYIKNIKLKNITIFITKKGEEIVVDNVPRNLKEG